MTIFACFHRSNYINFRAYFLELVSRYWKHILPILVTYEKFDAIQHKVMIPLMVYLKQKALGFSRGINSIDSTNIKVCHFKMEKQHKASKGYASKGKRTLGWFFGF